MKVKLKIKKDQLRKKLGIVDPIPPIPVDYERIQEFVTSQIPEPVSVEEPKDYSPEIEELNNKIEELKKQIKQPVGQRFFGAKGIQLFVDGSRKGLTSQAVNLIAGTGITLTYSYANGRNDVVITGGGGTSVLTATGTVDGSNNVFTFASAPVIIIVDGVPRQKTQSDSTANWTGTTTVTLLVAPNSDIYGLG